MAIRISNSVVKQLQENGFLPKDCANVLLDIPANGAMKIIFEVWVTDEHLKQLGGAFLALAEEREKLTRGD